VARTVPFAEARAGLTELLDELRQLQEHVVITRNGRPAAVLMSTDEYEAIQETIDVLADAQLLDDLAASEQDVRKGRLHGWKEVRRELGLA
jgi:prevent-host-death family protein